MRKLLLVALTVCEVAHSQAPTPIQGTDFVANSRTVINSNFANLYQQTQYVSSAFNNLSTLVNFAVAVSGTRPVFNVGGTITFSGGGSAVIIDGHAGGLTGVVVVASATGSITGTFLGSTGTAICTVTSASTPTITSGANINGTINVSGQVIYLNGSPFISAMNRAGGRGKNLFIGFGAGNFTMGGTAQQAIENIGIGSTALSQLTTGSSNTCLGSNCLFGVTSGLDNTAFGFDSLASLSTGSTNSGFADSLLSLTTGSGNAASGSGALTFLTTGSNNAGFGAGAGFSLTTGSNNILLMSQGGITGYPGITTGSGNVVIGNINGLSPTAANTVTIADGSGDLRLSFDQNGAPTEPGAFFTPSSSSASCVTGAWAFDASYYYACVATNTWKRAALSGF